MMRQQLPCILSNRTIDLKKLYITSSHQDEELRSDFPLLRVILQVTMEIFARERAAALIIIEPKNFKKAQSTILESLSFKSFSCWSPGENRELQEKFNFFVMTNGNHTDNKFGRLWTSPFQRIAQESSVNLEKIISKNPILPKGKGPFIPVFADYRRYEKYVYPPPPPRAQQKNDYIQFKMLEKTVSRL